MKTDPPLSAYSDVQLADELARRKAAGFPPCVFWLVDADDQEPDPSLRWDFLVATKKYYLEEGGIDDRHLGDSVFVPEGFDEIMESVFRYDGPPQRGIEALKAAGYEYLEGETEFRP